MIRYYIFEKRNGSGSMRLPDYKEARTRDKRDYKRVEFSFEDSIKGKYKGKTFFLKTYGCQMNEHDSENIEALLIELGFSKVDDYNLADLVLLNTCSIRENAHNKAFGMLGRLKHLKQEWITCLLLRMCRVWIVEKCFLRLLPGLRD